jgi:hypothetical protein
MLRSAAKAVRLEAEATDSRPSFETRFALLTMRV